MGVSLGINRGAWVLIDWELTLHRSLHSRVATCTGLLLTLRMSLCDDVIDPTSDPLDRDTACSRGLWRRANRHAIG